MGESIKAIVSKMGVLNKQQEQLRERGLVLLREQIAILGVTAEELFGVEAATTKPHVAKVKQAVGKGKVKSPRTAGGARTPSGRAKKPVTHREPDTGNEWNGMGPMPKWLKAYKNPDDLRV